MENKQQGYSKIISILFPFSLWLSYFDTFISGFTIGDIGLMIMLILGLATNDDATENEYVTVNKLSVVIVLHFLLSFMAISFADKLLIGGILKRSIKLLLYIMGTVILCKKININICIRTFEIIIYILTAAIVLQYFIYYAFGTTYNIIQLPGLNYTEEYVSLNTSNNFRPSGFFLEPSHLTQFVLPIIVFELFGKYKSIRKAFIFSACCLLSTSSTAVILLLVIWILYFLIQSSCSPKEFIKSVILLLIISIIIYFAYKNISQITYAVDRLMDTESNVYSGRLGAGEKLVQSVSGIQRFIGYGYGNVDNSIYMNSINYMYYCGGYFLIALWGLFALDIGIYGNRITKIMLLCLVILCFACRIFISMYLMYYLIFAICGDREDQFVIYQEYGFENI